MYPLPVRTALRCAYGGYAPAQRSFFIFARLNAPLGGPPYFFVTGLAGGFGINRSLTVPPIDELNLPEILKTLVMEKRGLILMVGATGAGGLLRCRSISACTRFRSS